MAIDLKEFNSLMAQDAERSQALLNALMVFNSHSSLDKQQKALLGLYESFSEEIKADKKTFAESFFRFFEKFPVNEDNIAYHQTFSVFWTTTQKQKIETKNSHWVWDKASFKNTLEFSKAFEAHSEKIFFQKPEEVKAFLVKYQGYLNDLKDKEKEKLLSHFIKKGLFKYVVNVSYPFFKEFTTELGLSSTEVLKNYYVGESNYYGIGSFFRFDKNNRLSVSELQEMLEDIHEYGLNQFFEHDEFLLPQNKKHSSNKLNMAYLVIHFISEKKYDLAAPFFRYFPDEMIKTMGDDYELQDLLDKNAWKKYIEDVDFIIKKNGAGVGTNTGQMALRYLDEAFSYINKYMLYKNMNEKLVQDDESNESGAKPISKI